MDALTSRDGIRQTRGFIAVSAVTLAPASEEVTCLVIALVHSAETRKIP